MGAQRPEDIHHLFSSAFNEGNVDAIIALYEPEGALIPQPGQVTRGHTAIRHALLRGQWTLTGTGPDGSPVRMVGQSVEIARQQPTGDWLLAIDHPFGAD